MQQFDYRDVEGMQQLVSEEFGPWGPAYTVTQQAIDQFAELSGDDYWIHTDPQRAATESPFGTTIAHGFLTLILLSRLGGEPQWQVSGYTNMLNYGSDKLRFTGIVPAGASIHARSRVKQVRQVAKGTQMTLEQQVAVLGQERPALVYELILIYQ